MNTYEYEFIDVFMYHPISIVASGYRQPLIFQYIYRIKVEECKSHVLIRTLLFLKVEKKSI